jgi:hypothetical protein
MVKITDKKGKIYDYPNKIMDIAFIDKTIKDNFKQFCKERKINKSKLIESFYQEILIKMAGLNISQGYITINIFA